MLNISLFVLWVFRALTVIATVCTIAIWAIVLKEIISVFLEEFGPKKTVAMATMALVFLSVAVTHAGDTITRIEDGNLVYYQKTGIVVPDVPKGLTAEQAYQLVDGTIPAATLSVGKAGSRFGLPITKIKTDTISSFRGGWITEEVSNESLSIFHLSILAVILLYFFPGVGYIVYIGYLLRRIKKKENISSRLVPD